MSGFTVPVFRRLRITYAFSVPDSTLLMDALTLWCSLISVYSLLLFACMFMSLAVNGQ